jgi:competence protein ComEA
MKRLLGIFIAFIAMINVAFASVNINTATKEQLESLPGVGPVKAQSIVEYRTKNGPFKSLEDLKKVSGIGDATFENLKSKVTLTGVTKIDPPAATSKADSKPATSAAAKPGEKAMAADAKKTEAKKEKSDKPVKEDKKAEPAKK